MNQIKLSLDELESYRGQGSGKQLGKYLRYYCPIHESDNQRSFSLEPEKGSFRCYSCGVWGYLEEHKKTWIEEKKRNQSFPSFSSFKANYSPLRQKYPTPSPKAKTEKTLSGPEVNFGLVREEFQKALPKSVGEDYLKERGISLKVALEYGVGYASNGTWPHQKNGKLVRQWKWGRVVFPHTNLEGNTINLYGRAVEKGGSVPSKADKHAHLPGKKGIFNATALKEETIFICESAFNALSLISAGYKNTCALFGLSGLPWDWLKAKQIVFCLDNDSAGKTQQKELLWEGKVRGYEVFFLPNEVYGEYNDLNEVWRANKKIEIGDWEEKRENSWKKEIQNWSKELQEEWEEWEEKSEKLEFEGGLSRREAESKAFEEINLKL